MFAKSVHQEWTVPVTRTLFISIYLVFAFALAGCSSRWGGASQVLLAPQMAQEEEALVNPGDRISLRVFEEEEMNAEYPVDEDGFVVLPKLGLVRVDTLSVRRLPGFLREAYTEYLRNPAVEVAVFRRIGVHGEVNEPTIYWLDITMTLRDAIAMAGGVTERGNPNRIMLVRGDDRFEFEGYGRSALLAVGLRSGDQIIVDRRSWLSLNAPFLISASISVVSVLSAFVLAK